MGYLDASGNSCTDAIMELQRKAPGSLVVDLRFQLLAARSDNEINQSKRDPVIVSDWNLCTQYLYLFSLSVCGWIRLERDEKTLRMSIL